MDYHIRGRIEPTTRATFMAIAIAVPFQDKAEPLRKLEAVCRTRAQAAARLRELTIELGTQIRNEGGRILDVVTDD